MKAITLTQPWATLVALGAKKIETRSWSTSYRGPLAIHAAKGLGPVGGMAGLRDLIESQPFNAALCDVGSNGMIDWWGKDIPEVLPRGAVVAVCELVICLPVERLTKGPGHITLTKIQDRSEARWDFTEQEQAFGDYSYNRFAWLLADVRALPKPIPAKGALGLWEWEGEGL
jgi:hypothetical protein